MESRGFPGLLKNVYWEFLMSEISLTVAFAVPGMSPLLSGVRGLNEEYGLCINARSIFG